MTSPASKFRKSAQGLQKQIDHKRSPRLTNTAKRMREWESAIQDALAMEKLQDKLNALADAWDNITLPVELSTLKDVAQVECLLTLERVPTNPDTDSYKRMERAELLDPERYTAARNALLEMGNAKARQEDKSIQLKRIEMYVDNSRIAGYFPTPDAVIRTMLEQVEMLIGTGDYILEPSAGKGSIADVLRREYPDAILHCVEWNHSLREILELKEHTVICDDIFEESLMAYYHKYKLIVMNPPWGKEYGMAEDARHILHCYENFLADDGQLIGIVSASATYNQSKAYDEFREFVNERGYFVEVPLGAFKNADRSTGTSVKIVVLDKRSDAQYETTTFNDPLENYSVEPPTGDEIIEGVETVVRDAYAYMVQSGIFPFGATEKAEPPQANPDVITEGEFIAKLEDLNQDIQEFLEDVNSESETPIKQSQKVDILQKPKTASSQALEANMALMRKDKQFAIAGFQKIERGETKDTTEMDRSILHYACSRVLNCKLPIFTAKLIELPEKELHRLVNDKRLATVKLPKGRTAYYVTQKGSTIWWGHLEDRINKFLDWYITEPEGISEMIIRDLDEALTLMKQIHDANNEKALSSVKSTINEETAISPRKQVQNALANEPKNKAPKMKQLRLF